MGKLKKFMVVFEYENEAGVFLAGRSVKGNVEVQLSAPMEIRCIKLKLLGRADVHWTENRGKNNVVNYYAKERYIEELQYMIGSDKDRVTLPAGVHRLPFAFPVPPTSPTSFEGDDGEVFYAAEATMGIPWAFDKHSLWPFTVAGILDLNAPELNEFTRPTTVELSKEVTGLLSSGKVSARISTSRRSFVIGETAFLSVEISNDSNRKVKKMWAKLKQFVEFRAQKSRWSKKSLLLTSKKEVIQPGCTGNWLNVPIVIPGVPPTNLAGNCSIIKVSYALKFYTDTGLKVAIPLVIGTVALNGTHPLHDSYHKLVPSVESAPPSYEETWNK